MFDDSRLLGIRFNTSDIPCYFLNVYMPYQCDNNYDLFVEYIGKISSRIEESVTSNVIILGDFNAAVDTVFEFELLEMWRHISYLYRTMQRLDEIQGSIHM